MTKSARIVRQDTAEPTIPAERLVSTFTGPVTARRISAALGTEHVQVNVLRFDAGSRSKPHSHSRDQLLYYVSGRGVVAIGGGEDQFVEAGEFALLPSGIVHMHGAADDGPAVHISIMDTVDNDFDCPIPEAWRRWRA
jgi:quercetin dioxygenase-like cupin family protein